MFSSKDALVTLSEGLSYLLEVIWAQRRGVYHMTVGVKLPNSSDIRALTSDEWLIKYEPGTRNTVLPYNKAVYRYVCPQRVGTQHVKLTAMNIHKLGNTKSESI